jgi:heme/copper-type cytochrome/quinol oxidase subunit 2
MQVTPQTIKSSSNYFTTQSLNWDVYRLIYRNMMAYNSLLNNSFSKRLLKTRRILVLPAHFNISVITNSFDVVHSWYVPGLGIKLDCVPGRSTHHNIYIANYGFYYGQCAEICGRYHHHMPIRVCALPFEHFCVWWYNYSVNVYCSFSKNRLDYNTTVLRNYSW